MHKSLNWIENISLYIFFNYFLSWRPLLFRDQRQHTANKEGTRNAEKCKQRDGLLYLQWGFLSTRGQHIYIQTTWVRRHLPFANSKLLTSAQSAAAAQKTHNIYVYWSGMKHLANTFVYVFSRAERVRVISSSCSNELLWRQENSLLLEPRRESRQKAGSSRLKLQTDKDLASEKKTKQKKKNYISWHFS